jgi:hypothetical protein
MPGSGRISGCELPLCLGKGGVQPVKGQCVGTAEMNLDLVFRLAVASEYRKHDEFGCT